MKVVFTWMEGKATREVAESFAAGNSVRNHSVEDVPDQGEIHICSHQDSKLGSKNCAESNGPQADRHPIDDILYWHNAIRMELHNIKEETRRVQQSEDFSDISAFNERLQFIADVCIYHRCVDLHLHSFTCYGHDKDGPKLKCSFLLPFSFSTMFLFSKKHAIRSQCLTLAFLCTSNCQHIVNLLQCMLLVAPTRWPIPLSVSWRFQSCSFILLLCWQLLFKR